MSSHVKRDYLTIGFDGLSKPLVLQRSDWTSFEQSEKGVTVHMTYNLRALLSYESELCVILYLHWSFSGKSLSTLFFVRPLHQGGALLNPDMTLTTLGQRLSLPSSLVQVVGIHLVQQFYVSTVNVMKHRAAFSNFHDDDLILTLCVYVSFDERHVRLSWARALFIPGSAGSGCPHLVPATVNVSWSVSSQCCGCDCILLGSASQSNVPCCALPRL